MKIYFILSLSFFYCCCATKLPNTKVTEANERYILDAYFKYRAERKRDPKSIEDLVVNGYLPESGYFYSKDIDMSLFPKKPHYTQSDYKIFSPETKDFIAIIGHRSDTDKSVWNFSGGSIGYASSLSRGTP